MKNDHPDANKISINIITVITVVKPVQPFQNSLHTIYIKNNKHVRIVVKKSDDEVYPFLSHSYVTIALLYTPVNNSNVAKIVTIASHVL